MIRPFGLTIPAWLKEFITWGHKNSSGFEIPPRPEKKIAIIGDIHGRFDLAKKLLAKVKLKEPDAQLILVGDYIDRGPESRKVLNLLQKIEPTACCLMGNHEAMLLDFLDDPIENGARWLRNGGVETLKSYDISLSTKATASDVKNAHAELDQKLADGTKAWLRSLPLFWQSGNIAVTHAGPDPSKPISLQENRSLLWGHKRFLQDTRTDGIWVAHGHWIKDRANCQDGRIAVDTGAYRTNHLTAAILHPDGSYKFLQT